MWVVCKFLSLVTLQSSLGFHQDIISLSTSSKCSWLSSRYYPQSMYKCRKNNAGIENSFVHVPQLSSWGLPDDGWEGSIVTFFSTHVHSTSAILIAASSHLWGFQEWGLSYCEDSMDQSNPDMGILNNTLLEATILAMNMMLIMTHH